jgi:hypothetical protein
MFQQSISLRDAQKKINEQMALLYASGISNRVRNLTNSLTTAHLANPLINYTEAFIVHTSKLTYSLLYHQETATTPNPTLTTQTSLTNVIFYMSFWCTDILNTIFNAIEKTPGNHQNLAELIIRLAVPTEEVALCRALGCSDKLIQRVTNERKALKAAMEAAATRPQDPRNN